MSREVFRASLLFLLPACFAGIPDAAGFPGGESFFLVYIESNTGGGSGGHLALGLGDAVYHFQQHEDGFFRLKREGWKHFRKVYNDLENRPMYLAVTDAPGDGLKLLQARLDSRLLAQDRNFLNLEILAGNLKFLESVRSGSGSLAVQGLGLFDRRGSIVSAGMKRLKDMAVARFGSRFIESELQDVDAEIAALNPYVMDMPGLPVNDMDLVPLVHSGAGRFEELFALKQAIQVLDGLAPVRPDALMDAGSMPGCFRTRLALFGRRLEQSILSLLGSGRPGRGSALLVEIARYQAVKKSLKAGHLLVLDPFPECCCRVSQAVLMHDRESMERLRGDLASRLGKAMAGYCSNLEPLDEMAYNTLENLAARFVELRRGLDHGMPVRILDDREVPCRKDSVDFDLPAAPVPAGIMEEARHALLAYRGRLRQIYGYNLLTENCVTELARELEFVAGNIDFPPGKAVARFTPATGGSFVPFRFFQCWVSSVHVRRVLYLPSFRQRKLLEMYRNENPVLVYAREFNTITSSVYRPGPADTSFLFFTDDALPPARPLLGAMNIGWGILNAASGILTMPVDRAARFRQGLWGMIYSLPELAFCNIRKGSFAWTGTGN